MRTLPKFAFVAGLSILSQKDIKPASQMSLFHKTPNKHYSYSDPEMIVFEGGETRDEFFKSYHTSVTLWSIAGYCANYAWLKYLCKGRRLFKTFGYLWFLMVTGGLVAVDFTLSVVVTSLKFSPEQMSVVLKNEFSFFSRSSTHSISDLQLISNDDGSYSFKDKNSDRLMNMMVIGNPNDYAPSSVVKFSNKDLLVDLISGNVNEVKKYKFVPK